MDKKQKEHEYYVKHREQRIQYSKDYYQAHKEKVNARIRKYRHEHAILYRNGKGIFGVNKAPYPADKCCPYCGRKRQLSWHHWDNDKPSKGVWICSRCHTTIHWMGEYPILKNLI